MNSYLYIRTISGEFRPLNVFEVEKIVDSGYFTDSQIYSEYEIAVQKEGAVYQEDNRSTYTFGSISL